MSALLFNAVTFDQSSGLYTYNYAVQNDSSSTIWNVDIMVGNRALGTMPVDALQPLAPNYTAPSGWTMYGAFSGSIASSPWNENGGFYEWYGNNEVIAPHANAFGFSITTSFAPTLDNGLNDYFMYGSEGVVAFGNIVVPSGADWMLQQPSPPWMIHGVPEPSTWLMLLIGFVALSAARRRLTVHPAPLSS